MTQRGTHGITVLHTQVVVLEIDLQVGQDELIPAIASDGQDEISHHLPLHRSGNPFQDAKERPPTEKKAARARLNGRTYLFPDLFPDDPRHLVPVQLDDGVLDLDLGRYGLLGIAC